MIRDEFKNADKKTINKKANKKMIAMGERAYYTKMMGKYSEISKPINFSTIFSLICFGLLALIYILPALMGAKDYTIPVMGWVVSGVAIATVIWALVWFIYLKPHLAKKLEFCKKELERLNREYVLKHHKS